MAKNAEIGEIYFNQSKRQAATINMPATKKKRVMTKKDRTKPT